MAKNVNAALQSNVVYSVVYCVKQANIAKMCEQVEKVLSDKIIYVDTWPRAAHWSQWEFFSYDISFTFSMTFHNKPCN